MVQVPAHARHFSFP